MFVKDLCLISSSIPSSFPTHSQHAENAMCLICSNWVKPIKYVSFWISIGQNHCLTSRRLVIYIFHPLGLFPSWSRMMPLFDFGQIRCHAATLQTHGFPNSRRHRSVPPKNSLTKSHSHSDLHLTEPCDVVEIKNEETKGQRQLIHLTASSVTNTAFPSLSSPS